MPNYCPPLPALLDGLGITSCEYAQMTPFEKHQLRLLALQKRNDYTKRSRNPSNQFKIGGFDMSFTHSLGRPLLDSAAQPLSSLPSINKNLKNKPAGFQYLGSGNAFSLDNIRDIWSAQVLTLWLTNGKAFNQFFMDGIVTLNGHSPTNLTPLKIKSNGRVTEDLTRILSKIPSAASSKGTKFVMGPDGIYGLAMDSILAEYARTGKLFGADVPPNAKTVFDRLLTLYTSNAISSAKASANKTPATSAANTPLSDLTGEAQRATGATSGLKDTSAEGSFTSAPSPTSTPGIVHTSPGTKTPTNKKEESSGDTKATEDEDNTLLYVGGAGLLVLAGGFAYMMHTKKKRKSF